ncbi:hypothetical protein Vadar_011913 [Vaccinium darrowii]|uniref:Uncharacterized protein n=1 Tax=Vaccinium darrowii TaxID=229202 RepID=A0ACB7YFA6_9ERIC|nr:hypothetical protein Vadar_011913 [Vaccinium darrowii]
MGHSAPVWDHKAAVELTQDWNGIDQIVLRNPQGASSRVSLHGGQVTSWRSDRGEELLFTSNKVEFWTFSCAQKSFKNIKCLNIIGGKNGQKANNARCPGTCRLIASKAYNVSELSPPANCTHVEQN